MHDPLFLHTKKNYYYFKFVRFKTICQILFFVVFFFLYFFDCCSSSEHRHELFQDCNWNDSKNPMWTNYIYFFLLLLLLLLLSYSPDFFFTFFRYFVYLLDGFYLDVYFGRWRVCMCLCVRVFLSSLHSNFRSDSPGAI